MASRDPGGGSTGNVLQQFGVGGVLPNKKQQSFDGFNGLMTGEAPSDDADLVQVLGREQKLLPTCSGQEDIDCGIDSLVTDLSVQDELHVSGTLEFLKDQFVHPAIGFDERRGHDRKRSGFFGVSSSCEDLSRDLEGARIHAAGHCATAAALRIVEGAADTGKGVHQHEDILPHFDESPCAFGGELSDPRMGLDIRIV